MESTAAKLARHFLKLYPWTRGRGAFGRMLLPSEVPEGVLVTSNDGCRFRTHADHVYEAIYKYGFYEKPQTRLYRKLIQAEDVVFDVGANIGWYTAHFAKWVGARGSVFAFEPLPQLADWIREAVELNGVSDICTVSQLGLGASVGESKIYSFPGLNDAHASMSDLGRADAQPHQCQVSTMDEFVEQHKMSKIDVVKLDCEGHEFEILAGATRTLNEYSPIIVFEINQECLRGRTLRAGDVEGQLRQQGYSRFWVIRGAGVAEVSQLIEGEDVDYIAAKSNNTSRLASFSQLRHAA